MPHTENIPVATADPSRRTQPFRVEHHGRVRQQDFTVFFESDDCALRMTPEAKLILELLPAMRDGRDVQVEQLDSRLYGNLPHIIDILRGWSAKLAPVTVNAGTLVDEPGARNGKRVGSFFSGGLDSFYTLLKHRDEITDIIFVHGLDIDIRDSRRQEAVSRHLRAAAAELGVNLIEIRTDMRRLWNPSLTWGFAHGAALAVIGHLLAPEFSRIYISSSIHSKDIFPWGTHPLLDPLWSSQTLEFMHEGLEATRVDKASLVATSPVALKHLRVCYKKVDDLYNCGRCRKCVQTMLSFEAAGKLAGCVTFPQGLPLELVRKSDFSGPAQPISDDIIEALETRSADHPLIPLLKRRQARSIVLTAWRHFREELLRALRLYWSGLQRRHR